MKQKIVKLFVLFLLIFSVVFGLASKPAFAACSYSGVTASANKSTVTSSDQIVFNTSINRSGQSSDCASSVSFVLKIITKDSPSGTSVENVIGSFNNGITANGTFTESVSSLLNNFTPANSDQLQFIITAFSGNLLGQSQTITVGVSGSSSSQGQVPVSVSLNNPVSVLNNGDNVRVNFSANLSNFNSSRCNNSAQCIFAALYVNNSPNPVASFPQIAGAFANPQNFSSLAINSADGFTGSSPTTNTITVKLFQSGTTLEIGEGSLSVQVQGITSATTGSGNSALTISPSTASVAANSNLTISWSGLTGLPTGSEVYVWVNQAETTYPISSNSVTIPVNSGSGFNMTGTNTVQAWVGDASGNQISSAPEASHAYTIAAAGAAGSTTPGTPAATTNNCTTGSGGSNCLYNPLPTTDLVTFILLMMKWLLGVIGIVAVLFIMIGGFKMVTAQGAEEAVTAARKTITWAIIGLVVAVLSFSMIAIVENILQANINAVSITTQRITKL